MTKKCAASGRRIPHVARLLCVVSLGCEAPPAEADAEAGAALPCEVSAALASCSTCHGETPQFGAPMPLVDVDDFKASARDSSAVAQAILARIADDASPMPPAPYDRLDDDQRATLAAWVDAGMPPAAPGTVCEGTGGSGGGGSALSCTPDVVLRKAAPYTMGAAVEDETKCFGIELPAAADKRQIIAMAPRVDNAAIVHHFLVFQVPTAQPQEAFDCALFPPNWELLYAWAPGAPAQELPEAAGFPIEAGADTHLVLQMHYNNYGNASSLVDDTAVELCTTTVLRPYDAGVMSFGGVDFVLPPNAASTLTCAFDVPREASSSMPIDVFQAWPHMHALGRSMKTVVTHAGGAEETLVDTDFSVTSQVLYPAALQIGAGDRVTTTCGWENLTSEPVPYGEASNMEMCFNIVGYYPKIAAPWFSGGLPVALSECVLQ